MQLQDVRRVCHKPVMSSNSDVWIWSGSPFFIRSSPYTQMYLTHIDENGNDTPPILIENSTAANRAVNLPEFVNVPPGGLQSIGGPCRGRTAGTDRLRHLDS